MQHSDVAVYLSGRNRVKSMWIQNGKLHRLDGPAIEFLDGAKFWLVNGVLHRDDGPAVMTEHGDQIWFSYGKKHRLDGPAIILRNGYKCWMVNDTCEKRMINGFIMQDSNYKEFKMDTNDLPDDMYAYTDNIF